MKYSFIFIICILNLLILTKSFEKNEKYMDIIQKIKSGKLKNIVFLTGAGISTSAGIPDFRSENGLFKQLQEKYNLHSPTEFFEIDTFFSKPELFYDFSKTLDVNSYSPTLFHYFMGFLYTKNLVKYVFTQNIDGLELKSGLPSNKVIFAHGNMMEAECPRCGKEYDANQFKKYIDLGKVLYCDKCGSPVKSKVVFYGENLPEEFFTKSIEVNEADLVFIVGTTLEVMPFSQLAYYTNENAYRVVINKMKIGSSYSRGGFNYDDPESKDLILLGLCDDIAKEIINDLGWEKEFNEYIKNLKK